MSSICFLLPSLPILFFGFLCRVLGDFEVQMQLYLLPKRYVLSKVLSILEVWGGSGSGELQDSVQEAYKDNVEHPLPQQQDFY